MSEESPDPNESARRRFARLPKHEKRAIARHILMGIGIGILSSVIGIPLAIASGHLPFFFVPWVIALTILIVTKIRDPHQGYIIGLVIAPILILAVLVLILMFSCGGMSFR